MKRTHTLAIALLIGLAAIAGAFAATRTAGLGASARLASVSDAQIAQRTRQLDRVEASLRRARAQRPPALPPVRFARVTPQRVVYVRPQPITVLGSAHGEDDAMETDDHAAGGEHGDDD